MRLLPVDWPREPALSRTCTPSRRSRTTSRSGTATANCYRRLPGCRSRTGCRSKACRPGRAAYTGGRPSRPRSSGSRRSTAATRKRSPAPRPRAVARAPFTVAAERDRTIEHRFAGLTWRNAATGAAPRLRPRPPLGPDVRNVDDRRVAQRASLGAARSRTATATRARRFCATCPTVSACLWQHDAPSTWPAPGPPERRSAVPRPFRPEHAARTNAAVPQRANWAVRSRSGTTGRRRLAFLTRRESPTEPPNYYVRPPDREAGSRDAISPTRRRNSAASRSSSSTYKRADGVPLSFTLYLPPALQAGRAAADGRVGLPAGVHRPPTPPGR